MYHWLDSRKGQRGARAWAVILAGLLAGECAGFAQGSDQIGLQELRAFDPSLTGSGVIIAQPEAIYTGLAGFEVNPAEVGQPASKFVYIGSDGTVATGFPNSVGTDSPHADTVGANLYGATNASDPEGVAPGVSEIDNYEGDYFINNIVFNGTAISAPIVNQSFIAITTDTNVEEEINQAYDNYAATYGTLFISAVGNGDGIFSPGSCYNGIGVAAYGGVSSVGPTYDGRSKPDITAPAGATSYATPQVTGAAAVLLQAAQRGDAGAGTESDASDARVLKALVLNGAVKPSDWTHTDTAPLDTRYGAGILNVYNSYMNLRAGEYESTGTSSGAVGAINSGAIVPDEGWAFSNIATAVDLSGSYTAESNHYLFDLDAATAPEFTLTSTLVWDRQVGETAINNLDLYLFDASTGTMIALSDSLVDNVQELYVQDLLPGDYDLVVTKEGGTSISGSGGTVVSAAETYALAFNFAPVPEPSTGWLLVPGLAGLNVLRRKLRRGGAGVRGTSGAGSIGEEVEEERCDG